MKHSLSAVKKQRQQFVNGSITLEDGRRSGRRLRSEFCEFLRVPIDETPFISCKRTCQKLQIRKTICVCILREDLRSRKCYLRWIPHSMTENEIQCRVISSEELLQVARHAQETKVEHLLTTDESWFYCEYLYDSAWAPLGTALPTRKAKKIRIKNAWFPLFGPRPAFTVFPLCLP
jgi:hypothetical protein